MTVTNPANTSQVTAKGQQGELTMVLLVGSAEDCYKMLLVMSNRLL